MNKIFCEKMDLFIDEYAKTHKNSGQLRVTLKDEIIYEKSIGFADVEKRIPFNKHSVFTLYSLSKPFCAIGLMKLKDRGMVDIDCHPGKYVPEAKGFDERVTIRKMLWHISGLPDFVQTEEFCNKHTERSYEQIREQLKEISLYPMVFEPGTGAMYANINFIICALIIENVSGMKYGEYMKKEVFDPLEMPYAQVDCEELKVDNRVKGHKLENDRIIGVDRRIDWMLGAGDIVGTLDDVYCLNKAIKQQLLLKPETWKEILTPSPIHAMGLGCTISNWHGKQRITHNGGSQGFRTLHIQLPEEDFDIIYLSNSGWGETRNDYAEAIYEAYFGKDDNISENISMDKGYI